MCCNLPTDLYDIVIVGDGPAACAAGFVARDAGGGTAVVWTGERLPEQACAQLSAYELALVEGRVRREEPHYVFVDGRLLYGEHIVETVREHPAPDAAVDAVDRACRRALPFQL